MLYGSSEPEFWHGMTLTKIISLTDPNKKTVGRFGVGLRNKEIKHVQLWFERGRREFC